MLDENLILLLEKPHGVLWKQPFRRVSSLLYAVFLPYFYAKALKRFLKNIFADIVDLDFIGQITFSRNFEKIWNKNVNFRKILKIILINENSFL